MLYSDGKLRTPCELVVRYLLPIYRSLIAKDLIEKYHFTQVTAAEKLGTTQAAISQYVHSKRGLRGVKHFGKILPMIQAVAAETAKRLASGEIDAEEAMSAFCKLCNSLREELKNFK